MARLAAGGIALACVAATAALVLASLQPVAAVEVIGARHVTRAAAIERSGLIGVPIFHASAAAARVALLGSAAVRDARVELALPASARLTLTEREAAARWVVGATEWFVDTDGVLFPSADPTAAPALRVTDLRVPARAAGDRLDAGLVGSALRLAKIAPGELRSDATAPAVRIEAGPNGLVLASGAGWEIRFGAPDGLDAKLDAAKAVLRESAGRRLEYVDVRTVPATPAVVFPSPSR